MSIDARMAVQVLADRVGQVAGALCDNEAELVERLRTDGDAYGLLYERYRDRVFRYLRTRTDSEEDAADLTPEIFARAFAALPQYRPDKGPFSAWVFGIARHAAVDLHRRTRPQLALDGLPPQGSSADGVEATAMLRDDCARLRRLLAGLRPEKRELLALRFGAGLTIPEIAKVIGKSPEATRKEIRRTLQLLEEHLR